MTRKAEFLARIKPILEKQEAKQDAIELAKDLSAILQTVNIDADASGMSDLQEAFNEQLVEMGKQPIVFSENTLKGVIGQFANAVSAGIVAGVNQGLKQAKAFLKDRVSLDEAYDRHKNTSGKKTGNYVKSGFENKVSDALTYEASETALKVGNNLRAITNEYNKAVNWEEQYVALLKYIKAYESLEKLSSDTKTLEKWQTIGEYNIVDLKSARTEIENSLQNIFHVAYGRNAQGLTAEGNVDVNVELKPIKTLTVKDVTGGTETIEVEVVPVVKKARKNRTANAYRGVHPSEDAHESKAGSRDIYGGEYWSTDQVLADGYQYDIDGAVTIKAHIEPINELEVELDGQTFDELDEVKKLQYLFPGLESFSTPGTAAGDSSSIAQKFYNEMARQAGFDSFRVTGTSGEGESDETVSTVAALQQRVVEYISKLPDFYQVESFTQEDEQRIISQQKGSAERWFTDTITRLKDQLASAQLADRTDDFSKMSRDEVYNISKYVPSIISELEEMFPKVIQSFDSTIEKYGGYIESEVQAGVPKSIVQGEGGKLIGLVSTSALKELLGQYTSKQEELASLPEGNKSRAKILSNSIDSIKSQLISNVPAMMQEQAEEMLDDFSFGDIDLDKITEFFSKFYTYTNQVQAVVEKVDSQDAGDTDRNTSTAGADESERKAAAEQKAREEAEKKRLADEAAAEAAEKERLEQEATARAKAEARKATLVSELDESYYSDNYYDEDELHNIVAQRNEIIAALEKEGLLTEDIRDKQDAITQEIEERLAYIQAERNAESTFDSLNELYDNAEKTDNPDAISVILEQRKQMLASISSLIIEAYEEQIESEKRVNDQIQQRIDLLRSTGSAGVAEQNSGSKQFKLKGLLSAIRKRMKPQRTQEESVAPESQTPVVQDTSAIHNANAAAIKEERQEQEQLNTVRAQEPPHVNDAPQIQEETTELAEQNDELRENINLQAQSGGHGVGTGTEGGGGAGVVDGNQRQVVDINESSLEDLLTRITYNVKIVDGDTKRDSGSDSTSQTVEMLLSGMKRIVDAAGNNTSPRAQAPTNTANITFDSLSEKYKTLGTIEAKRDIAGGVDATMYAQELLSAVEAEKQLVKLSTEEVALLEEKRRAAYDIEVSNSKANEEEKERLKTVRELENLYRRLGAAEADLEYAVDNSESKIAANDRIVEIRSQIAEKRPTLGDNADLDKRLGDIRTNSKSARSTETVLQGIRNLSKEYQKLGKLQAQYESTQDPIKKEELQQQTRLVEKEFERLKLNEQQYAVRVKMLEAEREAAYASESGKQSAKQEKQNFKQELKADRDRNRAGKADSAWRTGTDTLRSLWKIDDDAIDVTEFAAVKDLNDALKELDATRQHLAANKDKAIDPETAARLEHQTAAVTKQTASIKELIKNWEELSGDNSQRIGTDTVLNSTNITGYKQALTEAVMLASEGKAKIVDFDAATKTLHYTVDHGDHTFTEYAASVREADHAFVSLQGTTKTVPTLFQQIAKKTKEIFTYFSGSSVIYKAFNELRKGITYVREIDSALTDLKKVTNETEETYERFLDTAAKTAGKVGSTIKEIVSSTADWAKLGYSMEDAAKLAETTSVMLNVSEFSSIDEATSALVSTMQAFGYAAKDSMYVVDVMNEIGKFVAYR